MSFDDQPENQPETLYDLAKPRTVALNDGGRPYLLCCRRITDADWLAYFSGIVVSSERDGKSAINTTDVTSPRLALATAVLIGAEGYKVAGGASLTDLPGWPAKIPLAHRARLGEALADVRRSVAEDCEIVIHPEAEVVSLDAMWTADGATNATAHGMVKLEGLKHVLRTPTQQQFTRYSREANRSVAVGGSRTGKTVYRGCQPLLAALYDELIVSVEGYSVGGVPLTGDTAAIRGEMDLLHKVMAAQELFQPQETAALAGSAGEEEFA